MNFLPEFPLFLEPFSSLSLSLSCSRRLPPSLLRLPLLLLTHLPLSLSPTSLMLQMSGRMLPRSFLLLLLLVSLPLLLQESAAAAAAKGRDARGGMLEFESCILSFGERMLSLFLSLSLDIRHRIHTLSHTQLV